MNVVRCNFNLNMSVANLRQSQFYIQKKIKTTGNRAGGIRPSRVLWLDEVKDHPWVTAAFLDSPTTKSLVSRAFKHLWKMSNLCTQTDLSQPILPTAQKLLHDRQRRLFLFIANGKYYSC